MDDLTPKFSGRGDAGRKLAERLAAMGLDNPVVYALPRGGVPVAVEIARRLNAPLDLVLVRKIGAPGNPEVALGAIVEGPQAQIVINEDIKQISGAEMEFIERAYEEELAELERRRQRYLGGRERLDPKGRTVVVVDDGLATGATMKAALTALKRNGAARIVVALPVGPSGRCGSLKRWLTISSACIRPTPSVEWVDSIRIFTSSPTMRPWRCSTCGGTAMSRSRDRRGRSRPAESKRAGSSSRRSG